MNLFVRCYHGLLTVYLFLSNCLSVFLSNCLSVFLYFCRSAFLYLLLCLSVSLSLCLSVSLSLCLSVSLSLCLSVSLSLCLSASLSLCLIVSLSFCLSVFLSLSNSTFQSLCLSFSFLPFELLRLRFLLRRTPRIFFCGLPTLRWSCSESWKFSVSPRCLCAKLWETRKPKNKTIKNQLGE